MITEPGDAIIRVTSTTICGSDLHLYHNEFQGMRDGYILGHESMGFVDAIGPEVIGSTDRMWIRRINHLGMYVTYSLLFYYIILYYFYYPPTLR